jgi:hypothetical protein
MAREQIKCMSKAEKCIAPDGKEKYRPTASTRESLLSALRQPTGKSIDKRDFWK